MVFFAPFPHLDFLYFCSWVLPCVAAPFRAIFSVRNKGMRIGFGGSFDFSLSFLCISTWVWTKLNTRLVFLPPLGSPIVRFREIDLMGSWIFDENVNGTEDEFLDNVIKHMDFPLEEVEGSTSLEDWDASFQLLELPSSDILEGLPSNFGGKIFNNDSEPLSPSKYDEKPKLGGLPSNAQTTSNGDSRRHLPCLSSNTNPFCSSSSVSVLESSGSSSLENSIGFGSRFFIPVKRARSKRLRPVALNPRLNEPFVSTTRAATHTTSPACSTSYFEMKTLSLSKKEGREPAPYHLREKVESDSISSIRKCAHCEVTSTPQWREGPLGPKTLCNACGVRYRSGRLFPEYRPAASPTFTAILHSNSHKKVVEMRKKANLEVRIASR